MKIHASSKDKESIEHFIKTNRPYIRAGARVKVKKGEDSLYHCFISIKEK
ncbi:MAG: hypothetical protein PUD43_09170 [Clostridia bacterium]|nr:hypothetical protein [Clostridia bacterium]